MIKGGKAFDKEEAIASIRKTEVYGCTTNPIKINWWPSVEELIAKSEETLSQLRITKVEWNVPKNDAIQSLVITLSDGSAPRRIGRG